MVETRPKNQKHTLLIVDDDIISRGLLETQINIDNDYNILLAANGQQAIDIIKDNYQDISLVLLDIFMPVMDGFDVLKEMNNNHWIDFIPVIVLSGDKKNAMEAFNLGAFDFIEKGEEDQIIDRRVTNALKIYSRLEDLKTYARNEIYDREKNSDVVISILSAVVGQVNQESGLHVLHVKEYTSLLLKKLKAKGKINLTDQEIRIIKQASALHDIGKVNVGSGILNKPGRFTADEWKSMQNHTNLGFAILEQMQLYKDDELIQKAKSICKYHHENWDGSGYPEGLKGDEIPLEAQVVALADRYDGIRSKRCYKEEYNHQETITELQREINHFNPDLWEVFVEALPEIEQLSNLSITDYELDVDKESRQLTKAIMAVSNHSNSNDNIAKQKDFINTITNELNQYRFFAQLSNEVQYIYHINPDKTSTLQFINEEGAHLLGLPSTINNPFTNDDFIKVFGMDNLHLLVSKLEAIKPQDPDQIVNFELKLHIQGGDRWFNAFAQPIWKEDHNGKKRSGSFGKLIDKHEEHIKLDELSYNANHDPLTELLNRRSAEQLIKNQIKSRQDIGYAFLIIDIDFFKEANDTYGHQFGDEVLKEISTRLNSAVRTSDIIARIGGDEFIIFAFIDDSIIEESNFLTQRIQQAITGPYKDFNIEVSIGVSTTSDSGYDYEALFDAADKALYVAKNNGRKTYVFYRDLDSEDDNRTSLTPIE